jgi:hypothetical protein
MARADGSKEVRLIDLSPFGTRIEHLDLLHPGSACVFELPPALGALILTAQVVHSAAVSGQTRHGQHFLRYRSGLAFPRITADQQAALASALERLASGGPLKDGQSSV